MAIIRLAYNAQRQLVGINTSTGRPTFVGVQNGQYVAISNPSQAPVRPQFQPQVARPVHPTFVRPAYAAPVTRPAYPAAAWPAYPTQLSRTQQPAAAPAQASNVASLMRSTGWVRVTSNVRAPDGSFKNYKFSSVATAERAISDLKSTGQYGSVASSSAAKQQGNPASVLALIGR